MKTDNQLLAAFLLCQRVEVRKLEEGDGEGLPTLFELVGIEESNVLVTQFSSPEGYNCNIHRIDEALKTLAEMPVYVEPVTEDNSSEESEEDNEESN